MPRSELIRLSLRALMIASLLSGLGWWFGEGVAKALLPLIEGVIRTASGDYAPSLSVTGQGAEAKIQLNALVFRPIALTPRLQFPAGAELTANHHVMHSLGPLTILFTILLSWPVQGWAQRLALLGLGLFASLPLTALTVPFHLLGLLEIQLQEAALQAKDLRPEPWLLQWLYFCEMGGTWLLAIAGALAGVQLSRHFAPRVRQSATRA